MNPPFPDPNLVKTFTYDNKFYCAPKDFSTLALIINTDLWTAAGLTDADVPKTWADLETVAKKLTKGGVKGLVIGDTRDRIGAFMKQAGGWIVNADQTKMTANSPENLAALQEVQKLLSSGTTSFPKGVDAGWGGEAIGKGKAAMTIEGNWIKGAVKTDYPNLKWKAVELPTGPAGKGTLSFTQCYGVASASKNQAAAIDLVNYLSTDEPALALAKGLGVMPASSPPMPATSRHSRTRRRSWPAPSMPRARSPLPAWTRCSRTSTASSPGCREPIRRRSSIGCRRTVRQSSSSGEPVPVRRPAAPAGHRTQAPHPDVEGHCT